MKRTFILKGILFCLISLSFLYLTKLSLEHTTGVKYYAIAPYTSAILTFPLLYMVPSSYVFDNTLLRIILVLNSFIWASLILFLIFKVMVFIKRIKRERMLE